MTKKAKKDFTVLKLPYYGFNHEQVDKHFEGGLTFLNEFCVKGEYQPVAVYRVAKPNTKKGHKRYMLLQLQYDPITGEKAGGLVRGMTEAQMREERFQEAVACNHCKAVIFSMNRHDMHPCNCKSKTKAVWVDGGKDYLKLMFGKKSDYKAVILDLLTDTFEVIGKGDK